MEQALLTRIAEALERMAPPPAPAARLDGADAFIWHPHPLPRLAPVRRVSAVDIALLQGVEQQKRLLLENTLRFARGLPANNAMLWGARGMGKSSLVKAAHAKANAEVPGSLALIEIAREDIVTLPELLEILREQPRRVLVFCDDLSFEREDADYKALKSVLDGGIAGRPANVVFYATSNRRHLMPRDMIENEQQRAIHASESVEEKVSLSDRFGLWIGFHNCDQPTYFAMVEGYAKALGLPMEREALLARAKEWTITRGSRSGRVAWQFALDMAGELGVKVQA
ncbi:ATP-binding protein [Muricoccus vinaceus]|uniref:ATP-binding protein n=1 Tax=Muricoccus vinaceus TaxID=424704 RepID=A0ABV6IKE7_9PROT